MRNIKMIAQYDGTNFKGFAKQRDKRTVQKELEEKLEKILKEKVTVVGASRTDSGVHATCQVANFQTRSKISLYRLKWSLNCLLAEDVALSEMEEVPEDFYSRKNVKMKEYDYYVLTKKYADVFKRNFYYYLPKPLDINSMRKAARYLKGSHDFSSFCVKSSIPKEVARRRREIYSIEIDVDNKNFIIFRFRANAYLHHMIRIIVGTLLQIGLGKRKPEEIKEILEAKDRRKAGPTAPAKGLILTNIIYETAEAN